MKRAERITSISFVNLIRFLFATSVILSHSYAVRREFSHDPMHLLLNWGDLGGTAVFGFFFISGFLILKSALRAETAESYLAARALRIFPALAVTIMLCAFVLGPIVSTDYIGQYFSSSGTWAFLGDAILHHTQDSLPGVFRNHPVQNIVNVSIWTLPAEWTLYIVTLLACLVARRKSLAGSFSLSSWLFLIAALLLTVQMQTLPWASAWRWIACFFVGAICYLARKKVLLSLPVALGIMGADLLIIRHFSRHLGAELFPLALCYLIITFGYHPAVHVRSFHHFGDYSYGLYITGWPLQQVLVLHTSSALSLFAVAYPSALFLAILSWHFIEKPCLAFKGKAKKALDVGTYTGCTVTT